MNISRQTILSQARESERVQRLSRKGVGPSGSKRHPSRTDEDIVSSAWRHAAARNSGDKLATYLEDNCSDFGDLIIVQNRFLRNSDQYIIEPDMGQVATLLPMNTREHSKHVDATTWDMLLRSGWRVDTIATLELLHEVYSPEHMHRATPTPQQVR